MVPEKQPELHGCPSPSSQKPCSPSWEQGHPVTPVPAAIRPCIPPPSPELALLHSSTPCSRSVPCTPPPPLTRGNFPQRMTQGAGDSSFHSNAGFLIPPHRKCQTRVGEVQSPPSLERRLSSLSHPHHLHLAWSHPDKEIGGRGPGTLGPTKAIKLYPKGDRPTRG